MSKLGALTRGGDVKAERDTSEGSSFLAEKDDGVRYLEKIEAVPETEHACE